jgi:Uma2 family endonuclease
MNPFPGTATEKDLLWSVDRNHLVELVDGTLVEKTVGWLESLIAVNLTRALANFVREHRLGVVAGTDATLRMKLGNIRLPDVTFISVNDLPGGEVPTEAVPTLPPTLAAEVISEGNTKAEMRKKLREYFDSGSQMVWMLYPKTRTIAIFREPTDEPTQVLNETEVLEGGDVVPGFRIPVADLFKTQV